VQGVKIASRARLRIPKPSLSETTLRGKNCFPVQNSPYCDGRAEHPPFLHKSLHTAPDFPSRNIENAHRRNGQRLLGRRYCRLTRVAPLAQLAGQVTLNHGRSEVEFTGLICYLFRATVSTYLLRECGREQMILTPAAWFPRQRALHEEVRRRAKSPSCRLPLLHPIPPG
jgi:hypothetical protein